MNHGAAQPHGHAMLADAAVAFLHALREVDGEGEGEARKALCVVVHQFSHTPLYAPVYMVLEELRPRCTDSGGPWLNLEYRSTYNDREARTTVMGAGPHRENGCLHLGVSEVDPDHAPATLISKPFVKRLPLWGVALKDNPRIAVIRKALTLPQQEFGKLFAGKLSLLRPRHFGTGKGGKPISFSIYEKGTTAYRLFLQGLPPNSKILCKLAPDGDDFGLLLDKEVDVALTVQPWRGMHLALARNTGLEMVYTHMGRPEPISSLFMLRRPDEHIDLTRHFIDVLGALMQYHVAQLYAGAGMSVAYRSYLRAAGKGAGAESRADFTLAIQLLSDSRVYFHELGDNERRGMMLSQRLRQSMACHFGVGKLGDPVYVITNYAAMVAEKGFDWHKNASEDRLCDLLTQYKLPGVSQAFEEFGCGFEAPISETETPQARKQAWRITDPKKFLVCRFKEEAEPTIGYSPWRVWFDADGKRIDVPKPHLAENRKDQVEFGPWIHPAIREQAFRHLNAHFFSAEQGETAGLFVPARMHAGVLITGACVGEGQQGSNYEGISWFWIEYDAGPPAPTPDNNFMRSTVARLFLNMWRVNLCDTPPVQQIFCRSGHGDCVLADNGSVHLQAEGEKTQVADSLRSQYGLLFTFRVRGLVS